MLTRRAAQDFDLVQGLVDSAGGIGNFLRTAHCPKPTCHCIAEASAACRAWHGTISGYLERSAFNGRS